MVTRRGFEPRIKIFISIVALRITVFLVQFRVQFRNCKGDIHMQNTETMSHMMNDLIQYIMMPKIRYATGIGTYVSYDIAAYDCFKHDIITIVWDVTSDRDLALRMCERFNRYQLSPIHLEEAILYMIE